MSAPGPGPWIWSRRLDLAVFAGPVLFGFALAFGARALGFAHDAKLPEWGWVVLVLGVDVAHVWSTLFRTYLDGDELRRRPALYAGIPALCLAVGVALHSVSGLLFWRCLAYLAVFHFVRQQVGWVAIYRARAGGTTRWERVVDDAVIYLGTGVPLLAWHTRLPRPFVWFMDGDFVDLARLAPLVTAGQVLLALSLVAFGVRTAERARGGLVVSWGKIVVVVTTVLSWHVAIVVADDDLTFTALNVLPHGVPYVALLWAYARARAKRAPATLGSRIALRGLAPFVLVILACALGEEALWDRLVWLDRGWLFGFLPEARTAIPALLVPLLSLPQSTHYALDALLWRRGDTGPEQAEALGFRRG